MIFTKTATSVFPMGSSEFLRIIVLVFGLLFVGKLWAQNAKETLHLLGAIAGGRGGGVALIKNRQSGEIKAFRIGENAFGFGTVLSVSREILIIRQGKSLITITSKFAGANTLSGGFATKGKVVSTEDKHAEDGFQRVTKGNDIKVEVDGRYRDKMVTQELPKILMEAASEPVMKDGEIIGFKLFQIEQGSMFSKLGIKDGDTIKEINGVPLNNVAKTIQFLNGLKQEPNVKIDIVRDGVPVQMEMNVK
jgi:general secretion pathway protein C